jgi:hypothetical protein
MHSEPITCLCLSEDQLILSGSTSGNITISDPSSVQRVARLRSSDFRGNGLSLLVDTVVSMMITFRVSNAIINSWLYKYLAFRLILLSVLTF